MVKEKEIILDVNDGKIIPFVENVIISTNYGTGVGSIQLNEPIKVKRIRLYRYSNNDIYVDLIL
jgi:hypothetical protein